MTAPPSPDAKDAKDVTAPDAVDSKGVSSENSTTEPTDYKSGADSRTGSPAAQDDDTEAGAAVASGDPALPEEENNETGAPDDGLGLDDDNHDHDEDLTDLSDLEDFHEFDADNLDIEQRPAIAVDQSNVNLIGVHKRSRAAGEETGTKKRREGRREKKPRRKRGQAAAESGEEGKTGAALGADRRRKSGGAGERKSKGRKAADDDVDEESLTPQERRKRALDKKMDEALKRSGPRYQKRDLEAAAEKEIEMMRVRMIEAAQADAEARSNNVPAIHKLDLLPEVISLLNRNSMAPYIVDPETNILEAVRFFLEPLADGSLPAHNIQKELFNALAHLPITKDTLVASGIGKVTIFYTKTTRAQPAIKRHAESLVQKWSRPILENNAELRNTRREEVGNTVAMTAAEKARERERQRILAMPDHRGRARVDNTLNSTRYTIAPESDLSTGPGAAHPSGGGSAMRRMMTQYTLRNGAGGGGPKR